MSFFRSALRLLNPFTAVEEVENIGAEIDSYASLTTASGFGNALDSALPAVVKAAWGGAVNMVTGGQPAQIADIIPQTTPGDALDPDEIGIG